MLVNILKIGGSVITNKDVEYSLKISEVYRIAYEISKAYKYCTKHMILIHGGGSFGHSTVIEHGNVEKPYSIAQIIWFMKELNMIVTDALNAYGVPAVSFDTHAIFYRDFDGDLKCFYKPLEKALKKDIVVVLFGDIIFGDRDAEILSGDEIAWKLSTIFKPSRILFATDVDGVYDRNPEEPGSRLLEVVRISEVGSVDMESRKKVDVTGGMKAKILHGLRYWNSELREVLIFNGLKKDFIFKALCGESVLGSRVVL
ncbi:isopentenyl phosphate kinase [Ignisphaera sp. 4213-co]|uniref:Isopentenyl phosphate kinase n=1 Tax=Ignisphaera cupida TaxID=3050454 RepID=A0ABD4Z6E5_9CREN|nr:isopentenyl phosphate kinase [Ignisphaera sp. 4213-co]MDK6028557.1 isopentenyl phosphate kinase [Ignisphaera sp. 4213-co]